MKKNLATFLKKNGTYNVRGTLWVEYEGNRCFGPGRIELLQHIAQTGSINKAAKEMDMSYKKAWTMINELNEQFTEPLVITQSGGEGGGGSFLTDAALSVIQYHEKMRERFLEFLENEQLKLNK